MAHMSDCMPYTGDFVTSCVALSPLKSVVQSLHITELGIQVTENTCEVRKDDS